MASDGINRSAILLLSIGEDEAAEVLKQLDPREVQKIGLAMAELKTVSRAEMKSVMEDFCKIADKQTAVGSEHYIRNVLKKALGDDKSANLIARINQDHDTSGIDGLKWMDPGAVAELLKNEHPQIIATILVHLERDQASEILALMTERLRGDVLLRIATLDNIQPSALQELNEVLNNFLAGSRTVNNNTLGGVRAAAEILNLMPTAQEAAIIDTVKEANADLAQKIVDELFVWEDLLALDDKAIQLLLRETQTDSLILALKGSSETLREKILKNMSQRAGEALQEDLEAKGPVRVSEVEAQQKEILGIVHRLANEGQIVIGGKADEAYV